MHTATSRSHRKTLRAPGHAPRGVFTPKPLRDRVAAMDNYALVLLLIVLSILLMAVTDIAPLGRIVALILVGGTLLYAMHTSGLRRLLLVASILTVCAVALAVVEVVLTGRAPMEHSFYTGACPMPTNHVPALS
jgi:energy-coupling factor transporter transmembrane protein EcfT